MKSVAAILVFSVLIVDSANANKDMKAQWKITYKNNDGDDTCRSIDASEGTSKKAKFCVGGSTDKGSAVKCNEVEISGLGESSTNPNYGYVGAKTSYGHLCFTVKFSGSDPTSEGKVTATTDSGDCKQATVGSDQDVSKGEECSGAAQAVLVNSVVLVVSVLAAMAYQTSM